jgi:hypothetical protein
MKLTRRAATLAGRARDGLAVIYVQNEGPGPDTEAPACARNPRLYIAHMRLE